MEFKYTIELLHDDKTALFLNNSKAVEPIYPSLHADCNTVTRHNTRNFFKIHFSISFILILRLF